MSEWNVEIAAATATAERTQAAEEMAEARFDALHAQAEAAGEKAQLHASEEFRHWMAARHATDAAWGSWSQVMDSRPAA